MTISIEKLRSDIKYESRKFMIQLLVGVAATVAATATLMTFLFSYMGHTGH